MGISGLAKAWALLGALFAVFMCAGLAEAPGPLRASGAPGFDARVAQERLAAILSPQVAHPIDTAAEDVTRTNLLRAITQLGFRPEVHEAFMCRSQSRFPEIDCAYVRNIIFSIGPQSGPAVLAGAHYDSVPAGPGASDDGLGIAVWLEVARELAHAPLQRRIIFLLSDGEEPGLLGAYEFAHHDPLMQSVETLVELDQRGTRGPAVFFETNQPNAEAVRTYATAPRPVANSIAADIYRLLPNSTDVSVLTRPGLNVINIALIDGLWNYHTPQDTIASQDLRSVQQIGDQAIALLRGFASSSDRSASGALVYTDIFSRVFVSAPAWLSHLVLGLSALVAAFAFSRSGATQRWRALALPPLALGTTALLAFGVGLIFELLLRPGDTYWWSHPEFSRAWCLALGLAGAPIAALILRAKLNADQAETTSQLWFAGIGALATFALPGLSILFVVPATLYALGVVVAFAWKPAQALGAGVAAIAALAIWAPMLSLNELGLGFQFPFANALCFALASLPWLGPLARLLDPTRWRALAIALGGAAVVAIVAAAVAPSATASQPLPLNILYFYNTATGQAHVLAGSVRRALPRELAGAGFAPRLMLPGDHVPYWAAPITAAPVGAPSLDDARILVQGAGRVLRARLSTRAAYRSFIRIPLAAGVTRVKLNGVDADFRDTGPDDEGDNYVTLSCQGRACDGVNVEIALGATPTDWAIMGLTPGLPAPAQSVATRRPPTRTPIHFGDDTVTLSRLRV